MPITNEMFLEEIFGDRWKNALIAAFPGDPEVDADWRAYRAGWLPPAEQQARLNTYFCPSLVQRSLRQLNEFVSFHVIVVDDYGTKIDAGKPELVLGTSPSYLIETSLGNYQAGWKLSRPVGDLGWVRGVLGKLKEELGAGDNLRDPMVWRRLPVGINGKAKHRDAVSGQAWQVRAHDWRAAA